jgi:hypothetical protein
MLSSELPRSAIAHGDSWIARHAMRERSQRLRVRRMSDTTARERDWGALVRQLSPLLDARRPECVATIAVRPTRT